MSPEENDIFFPDDSLSHLKIADLLSNEETKIENVNIQEYQEISRQILLGKCINSDLVIVHDDNLYVKSSNYTDIPMGKYYFSQSSTRHISICMNFTIHKK